jgi:hypothetical protein
MQPRTTLAALIAVTSAGGAAVWALASCGPSGTILTDDAGGGTDAPVDARLKPKDAAPEAAADAGFGPLNCKQQPGWKQAHPFRPACTMQIAPPELWDSAKLPMRACDNGQAKCMQLALPRLPSRPAPAFARPAQAEESGFELRVDGDPDNSVCRRTMRVIPTADAYRLQGVFEIDARGSCNAIPLGLNDDFALAGSFVENVNLKPRLILSGWNEYAPKLDVELNNEFPTAFRSNNTVYSLEPNYGKIDVIDVAAAKLLRTNRFPQGVQQWSASFAAYDDLWGLAVYGTQNKGELWRSDALGNNTLMLSKPGVHIFAPSIDGTLIYWVEASGNELDIISQPKIEIWAGNFSKDPVAIRQSARRLADVSGVERAHMGHARNGYYAVNLGVEEMRCPANAHQARLGRH